MPELIVRKWDLPFYYTIFYEYGMYKARRGDNAEVQFKDPDKTIVFQNAINVLETAGGGTIYSKVEVPYDSITYSEKIFIIEDYQGSIGSPYQFPYSCIVHKPDPDVEYYEAYKNIGRKYTCVKRYDDAVTVIQQALNSLTAGRTWKETVLLKGSFTFTGPVRIPSYTGVVINGKIMLANGANSNIFTNSDFTAGDRDIEIIGGELDGNRLNQTSSADLIYMYKVQRTKIRDVYIHDVKGKGIHISGGVRDNELRNNLVQDTEGYHYGIFTSYSLIIGNRTLKTVALDSDHFNVGGNYNQYVNNFLYDEPGTSGEGFAGAGNNYCVFKGNILYNVRDGIWLHGSIAKCSFNLIVGNIVIGQGEASPYGISDEWVDEYNMVEGNLVTNFKHPSYGWGVLLLGTGDYSRWNLLYGNRQNFNASGPIALSPVTVFTFSANNSLSPTGGVTRYIPPSGTLRTINDSRIIIPRDGALRHLVVGALDNTLNASASFSVLVNSVYQFHVNLEAGETFAENLGDYVNVSKGDNVSIRLYTEATSGTISQPFASIELQEEQG